jgi:hypothetical protein
MKTIRWWTRIDLALINYVHRMLHKGNHRTSRWELSSMELVACRQRAMGYA